MSPHRHCQREARASKQIHSNVNNSEVQTRRQEPFTTGT